MNRIFWLFLNLWNTWIFSKCFSTNQDNEMPNSASVQGYIGFSTNIFTLYWLFDLLCLPDSLAHALSWTPIESRPTKKVEKLPEGDLFSGEKYLVSLLSLFLLHPAEDSQLRGHGEHCCRIHNLPFVRLVSILYPGNQENKVHCLLFFHFCLITPLCALSSSKIKERACPVKQLPDQV